MKHEVIMRRKDKSRVKLEVSLEVHFTGRVSWSMQVYLCPYRKRTWTNVVGWSYSRQRLGYPERVAYELEKQMAHVTAIEIHDAKEALWYKLRPVPA